MVSSPRPCSYCKHTYANPCDGKDPACGNKLHLDGLKPEPKRERIKVERPTKRKAKR